MKTMQLICLVVFIGYMAVIKAELLKNVLERTAEKTNIESSFLAVDKRVSCSYNFNKCKLKVIVKDQSTVFSMN